MPTLYVCHLHRQTKVYFYSNSSGPSFCITISFAPFLFVSENSKIENDSNNMLIMQYSLEMAIFSFTGWSRHLSLTSATVMQFQSLNLEMATVCKLIRCHFSNRRPNNIRCLNNNASSRQFVNKNSFPVAYIVGGAVTLYTAYRCRHSQCVHAIQARNVS